MIPHSSSSSSLCFADLRARKLELMNELQQSWKNGAPLPVEDVLERWPTDPGQDQDVASLLFEDYQFRAAQDESTSLDEYRSRFPEHQVALTRVVSCSEIKQALGGVKPTPKQALELPGIGDRAFGFTLERELGRGAFARVFLARQENLAGRPVALKVSAIEGDEPQTLAQLQHTHVVPIYSVHEDPRAGLRAVCMPYFGGASLSQILEQTWSAPTVPVSGADFVNALSTLSTPAPDGDSQRVEQGQGSRAPVQLMREMTYVQTAAWIVARLAEGLQHAHHRGVLHRDIKPSNVLICADGQPMLLDFNLSQHLDQDIASAGLGGTLAYMAPEHLEAIRRREAELVRQVDGRADTYSLGMVLYEILVGERPYNQSEASHTPLPMLVEALAIERAQSPPSLRRRRPDVPWSLESIVHKCLSPSLEDRYQQPEDLEEDLQRFLEDRPLKYAPEPSLRERVQKLGRRHPRLLAITSVAMVAGLLLSLLGLLLASQSTSLKNTQERLYQVQVRKRKQACDEGASRALLYVNTMSDLPREHFQKGREVCEQALAQYRILEGQALEKHLDWKFLSETDRRQVAEDVQELLLALALARDRLAPGDAPTLKHALRLLALAEQLPGLPPSRALLEDRATYLVKLGKLDEAKQAREQARRTPIQSARDHYLLANSYVLQGDLHKAITHLDTCLRLNPKHYWSWMQRGACRLELGDYPLALGDFSACIGLWPDFAWGYFNRGVVLDRLGRRQEAIANYTLALDRDPNLLLARRNRGLALLEMEQHQRALADFEETLKHRHQDAIIHLGLGIALEKLRRFSKAEPACQRALQLAEKLPVKQRIRTWEAYGFAVGLRLPRRARKVFEKILTLQPRHPQALYGIAMILDRDGKPAEALPFYNRAIEADPGFVEPRRFRALLYAREGEAQAAVEDINWCLGQTSGQGANLYAAACVTALLSDQQTDSRSARLLRAQSLDFLGKAFAAGYGQDRAHQDEDLRALWNEPEMKKLMAQNKAH